MAAPVKFDAKPTEAATGSTTAAVKFNGVKANEDHYWDKLISDRHASRDADKMRRGGKANGGIPYFDHA